LKNSDADSIGLEIADHRTLSFNSNYEVTEAPERARTLPLTSHHSPPPRPPPPPPPAFAKPFLQQTSHDESQSFVILLFQ
jgi:hypothetical protein